MSQQHFEARVLDRTATAGDFVRLQVLCAETGLRSVLMRGNPGKGRAAVPDLFDRVAFEVDQKEDGSCFVRDLRILLRHPELAQSYEALSAACRLARVLLLNRGSPENAPAHAALLERSIAAFASGVRPDCTYLKCLFLLLREEGYPVREDWLMTLTEESAMIVISVLATPLAGQTATPDSVRTLTRRLETWAASSLDLRFPDEPAGAV